MKLEITQDDIRNAIEWRRSNLGQPINTISDEDKLSCNCIIAQTMKRIGLNSPNVGFTNAYTRDENGKVDENFKLDPIGMKITRVAPVNWGMVNPCTVELIPVKK